MQCRLPVYPVEAVLHRLSLVYETTFAGMTFHGERPLR